MTKIVRRKQNKSVKKNTMQTVFTRFMFVVAILILWIGAIGVRLVHLQINESEWLRDKAQSQRRDLLNSKMLRGTIYDRANRTLAMSVKVKSLYANPLEIEDLQETAGEVAKILKADKKEILEILQDGKEKNKQFVWLERKVEQEKFEEINEKLNTEKLKKYDLPRYQGLHWKEEQKRSYPYKSLAAQVIGFSNSDDFGQAGIEMSHEEILRGEIVKKWQDRDRLGRVYDESEVTREPPKDIVLTLSSAIQYKTETALERGAKASNATSGMAIVLVPRTGEILAMANYPSFDLNEFGKAEPEILKNKAIQDLYSPGSVFKLITYGAALEENLIAPQKMIDCGNGVINIAGHVFRDSHQINEVTYTKAFAHSSNVGAIKTGMLVGRDIFYDYSRKFGFGQTTGIELPAEAGGIFAQPESWHKDSLASKSIGYEMGVTALQVATAYATVANNGVKIQPHIIKEIKNADGKTSSQPNVEKTRVLSPKTAYELRKMLRQVVLDGTARRATLNGYTSAGKTGTAWKYDQKLKKVNREKYISSFVGFAPADDPAVVIAVVMNEPKGGRRDGGFVSAPVFREIAEQILPELGVQPQEISNEEINLANDINEEVPDENVVAEDNDSAEENSEEPKPKIAQKEKTTANKEKEEKKEKSKSEEKKPTEKKVEPKKADKPKDAAKSKTSTGKKEREKDKP